MSKNIIYHNSTITLEQWQQLNQHKAVVLWFTGLSGAGKSTLAYAIEKVLYQKQCRAFVLDGDNIRLGLTSDLGFSDADRRENIRRISEVAKLMMESGTIVMTAFISPFVKDRENARKILPHGNFIEIYCKASLAVCEKRDVKGFYKKARAGEIKQYTGVGSVYEPPLKADLVIDSEIESLNDSVSKVIKLLQEKDIIDV